MTMTSFAAVKRRIQPGTRLLCVENTYRPELDGQERTVEKVQANGFWWTRDGDERRNWTQYPAARDVTVLDADTWRFKLARTDGYVELRFLAEE
jgi:hypothetical protein